MKKIIDFIQKTVDDSGASGVVVGVSGGVDSAVVLTLCVQALGAEKVHGLHMPSDMNQVQDSVDAHEVCRKNGLIMHETNIAPYANHFAHDIPWLFAHTGQYGNLCARIRMILLYAHAAKNKMLVAGTGNRTEYLLGYTTKFGDNAADFYPILHLWKTEVWELAKAIGVPEAIIMKAPSAGLWPGQTDEGEIGLPYTDIDLYLKLLEGKGFTNPGTPQECALLGRYHRNHHKMLPGESLL